MKNIDITQASAVVSDNIAVGKDYRKILLDCPAKFAHAVSGQFVTLALPWMDTPILRRPFSIHRISVREKENRCHVAILFKVIGKFTRALAGTEKQAKVDILGPLGSGFSLPKKPGPVAIVGGGIGVAPLVFLAESLKRTGKIHENTRIFIGGRTSDDILCVDDFTRLGYGVSISTEDGSMGEKGMITELLSAHIGAARPETIYACGPIPMLKAVFREASVLNISCQVSVETVMACGIGICLGCAIQAKNADKGFLHVCKDGPVFNAESLWDPEDVQKKVHPKGSNI